MKHNPRQTGKCKICAYIKAHKGSNINQRILQGDSIASIAKDFGCCDETMARHAGTGKDKDGNPNKPHFAFQVKSAKTRMDEKEGLDLIACQQEVWDKSMKATDMALGKIETPATANLSAFGQCIAPATKIVEILAKIDDKPEVTQTNITNNYDNLSREELRSAIALATKIERPKEGVSEEKPT
jgi:uncharacterized protein (DUF433 family)